MKFSINLVASLIFSSTCIFSQEIQEKKLKHLTIHSFYFQPGLNIERVTQGTLEDFKKLAPQSNILSGLNIPDNYMMGNYSYGAPMLSILLGIQLSDRQKIAYKTNPYLRIGVSYFSTNNLSNYIYSETRKRYDTLTSAKNGQITFVDSINSKSYSFAYSSQQLRVDLSILFRTNTALRWFLYSGLGVSGGVSLNAKTNISFFEFNSLSTDDHNSAFPQNGKSSFESFSGPSSFGFAAYIPVGIDFRIGNNREFWKRLHLFYEFRPGINFTHIPQVKSFTNAFIQHNVGIRVTSI